MPCLHPSLFTFWKEVVRPDVFVFHGTHLMEDCYAQGVDHMRLFCPCSSCNEKIPGSIVPSHHFGAVWSDAKPAYDSAQSVYRARKKVLTERCKTPYPVAEKSSYRTQRNYNAVFESVPRKRNYMQFGPKSTCLAKRKMNAGQPISPRTKSADSGVTIPMRRRTFSALKCVYLPLYWCAISLAAGKPCCLYISSHEIFKEQEE